MTLPTILISPFALPAQPPASLNVSPEQMLDFLEYGRSITKRKCILSVPGVVAAAVALASMPIYRSTADVVIEAGKAKIPSTEDIYGNNPQREHFQAQAEILKIQEVAKGASCVLKLWGNPTFDPRKTLLILKGWATATAGMRRDQEEWTGPIWWPAR